MAQAPENKNLRTSVGNFEDLLKDIAEKQKFEAIRLKNATDELNMTLRELEEEENKRNKNKGKFFIAQQNLRTINEEIFSVTGSISKKEKTCKKLLKNAVDKEIDISIMTKEINRLKELEVSFESVESNWISQIKKVDSEVFNVALGPNCQLEKENIEILTKLKEVLETDKKSTKVQNILNGHDLEQVLEQKKLMNDAITEKECDLEIAEGILAAKKDDLLKAEQKLLMQKNLIHARCLKLQKKDDEMEDTISHLKKTLEYIEKQVDFGNAKYN